MDTNGTALHLLERLYDGVLSQDQWRQSLRDISLSLGAASAGQVALHTPTDSLEPDELIGMPPAMVAHFNEMQDLDPGRAALPLLAAGRIYLDYEFHGQARLQRDPFYQEFLKPNGLGTYALLPLGQDEERIYTFSVQREHGRPQLSDDETRLMHAVLPHLRTTLHLQLRFRQQQAESLLLRHMLDRLGFPLLVCSARGHIVQSNHLGGIWLQQPDCPLGLRASSLPQPIRRLLDRACGHGAEAPSAGSLALPDGGRLIVLPCPLTQDLRGGDALALVAAQGPQWRPTPRGTLLRTLFRLTPAEIRLAHHLARNDDPLPTVAETLGVSLNTLRTQLRSIFDKTQTRRQADLVRLMGHLGLLTPGD